jgi:hypothetical protein
MYGTVRHRRKRIQAPSTTPDCFQSNNTKLVTSARPIHIHTVLNGNEVRVSLRNTFLAKKRNFKHWPPPALVTCRYGSLKFSRKNRNSESYYASTQRSVHGGTRAAAAAEPAMHGPGYCYPSPRLQQPLLISHVRGAQHLFLLR